MGSGQVDNLPNYQAKGRKITLRGGLKLTFRTSPAFPMEPKQTACCHHENQVEP
jgi:hypothetical protein